MRSSLLSDRAEHQASDGSFVRLTCANARLERSVGADPHQLRTPSPCPTQPPRATIGSMPTTSGPPVDPGAAAHDAARAPGVPQTPLTAIDPYHQGAVAGPTTDDRPTTCLLYTSDAADE